jgi:hypothetical protein
MKMPVGSIVSEDFALCRKIPSETDPKMTESRRDDDEFIGFERVAPQQSSDTMQNLLTQQ